MTERLDQLEAFADEAKDLAYHSLDYFSGRPQELRPEARNRLSQRSRIALMQDPLAGAEADLLSNFALGRGVAVPDAEDEEVQKVIDEAWEDAVNVEKLTGFEAQRHRSNELLTQAQLYPTAYISEAGRVRLGFLDADTVLYIIADPEDEERPLYYASRKRRVEWDFENDRVRMTDEMRTDGKPRVIYWPHWRHVEDYLTEAKDSGETPQVPPKEKLGEGLVYHVRINRIGRTQFGTPPWARTLRFFTAMNTLTEAHVAMAEAASTFIAKRVMKGGPEGITRAANNILAQTGEIGATRFGEGRMPPDLASGMPAPPPGSFWLENEAHKLEALNLGSGAAQAATTAQIVRAPVAASSGFGQHYLGDAGNANLATATSLELPTLMTVQAWQETLRQMLKWFTDLVIQEAVRAGRLGGYASTLSESLEEGVPEYLAAKTLKELRLTEADEFREAERRTGRSLGYTLSMPYPGRRNLPDVTSTFQIAIQTIDPDGVNIPFRRAMLNFLATHGLQLDDPTGFVDEVLPEAAAGDLMKGLNPATNKPYAPGEAEAESQKRLNAVPPPPGEGGAPPKGERPKGGRGSKLLASEIDFGEEVASLFETTVVDPLLATSANGNGSQ